MLGGAKLLRQREDRKLGLAKFAVLKGKKPRKTTRFPALGQGRYRGVDCRGSISTRGQHWSAGLVEKKEKKRRLVRGPHPSIGDGEKKRRRKEFGWLNPISLAGS